MLALVAFSAVHLNAADYRMVVIPVEFSDVRFTDTQTHVYNKVEDARIYLENQFSPRYSFSFKVLPIVRLPLQMYRYGGNSTSERDTGLDEVIRTACTQSQGDFSIYDNDGDGFIDNVCIITAGHSEAEGAGADCIWPQQGWLHDRGGTLSLGAKTVDCFTVCPEFASAGTFSHEICHTFGLADMYDTDGRLSGGTAKGLWGTLSLMDSGGGTPNFCAIELEQLGFGPALTADIGHHTLRPLSVSRDYMRIESDNPGEYFLLECRDNNGWDANLGGAGLVIYHIDRSSSDAWYSDSYRRNLSAAERWEFNQVNCRPEHPCARLIEAVPGTDAISQVFFPQPGRTAFGSETDPAFRYWSGNTSEMAVCNIAIESDCSVSFDLIIPITLSEPQVFQDAAIVGWTVDPSLKLLRCDVTLSNGSTILETRRIYPTDDSIYSFTAENLEPQKDYAVTIRAVCNDGATFSRTVPFKTKMRSQGTRPFIYLNSIIREDDGTFPAGSKLPMRIYNASEARAIHWYFNGIRIYPASDGFWEIKTSGSLKAEIWYADGSCEVIAKKITVK